MMCVARIDSVAYGGIFKFDLATRSLLFWGRFLAGAGEYSGAGGLFDKFFLLLV